MLGLLGKRFTTLLITCCCFVTLGTAQSDAVIVGKVDSPQSRVVRFEYKRNHFSLEEGSFEAALDTNNVFAIHLILSESQRHYWYPKPPQSCLLQVKNGCAYIQTSQHVIEANRLFRL